MKFSALYETYEAMREPNFRLKADGTGLETGEGARLLRVECELTSTVQAGMLRLEAALDPGGERGAAWLKAVRPGALCSLTLGYGDRLTEVFCGFFYDVLWSDPLDGSATLLEALCLDLRGRLMLTACADGGAKRTLSQLVEAILGQGCCKELASKRVVSHPPEDWDLSVQRTGGSDYSVVCQAAEFLCYEFYAYADELYFGPPRPERGPAVIFDGPNGLLRLARRRTLAGQCAAVAVSGADDAGVRVYARQARPSSSGFGTDKMGGVLTGELHQPEALVRTMAQAQYLARARMERHQRMAGGMSGQCVGLPELRPGRFIQASELSEPVNGTYYVHTVRHVLDETGFQTWFEAEDE